MPILFSAEQASFKLTCRSPLHRRNQVSCTSEAQDCQPRSQEEPIQMMRLQLSAAGCNGKPGGQKLKSWRSKRQISATMLRGYQFSQTQRCLEDAQPPVRDRLDHLHWTGACFCVSLSFGSAKLVSRSQLLHRRCCSISGTRRTIHTKSAWHNSLHIISVVSSAISIGSPLLAPRS